MTFNYMPNKIDDYVVMYYNDQRFIDIIHFIGHYYEGGWTWEEWSSVAL